MFDFKIIQLNKKSWFFFWNLVSGQVTS